MSIRIQVQLTELQKKVEAMELILNQYQTLASDLDKLKAEARDDSGKIGMLNMSVNKIHEWKDEQPAKRAILSIKK